MWPVLSPSARVATIRADSAAAEICGCGGQDAAGRDAAGRDAAKARGSRESRAFGIHGYQAVAGAAFSSARADVVRRRTTARIVATSDSSIQMMRPAKAAPSPGSEVSAATPPL